MEIFDIPIDEYISQGGIGHKPSLKFLQINQRLICKLTNLGNREFEDRYPE
jgi:hypothetical protein